MTLNEINYCKCLLVILLSMTGAISSDTVGKVRAQSRHYTSREAADSASMRWLEELRWMEQVVVTGTRSPKMLKDVPIETRVITAQDILRSDATSVDDLLQTEMPGVEFTYAMSQQTHMNFSGFGGQSVLFLVDGERLAGETQDDVDFNRLTVAGVERIEIVKGAASALYGSNASGGVINVITKTPTEPWSLHLDSRLSKHGSYRYGGTLGLNGKHVQQLLTVNASGIDSYDVSNGPSPQTSNMVTTFRGDKHLNVSEKLTWLPTESLRLTARAGYFRREGESTTPSVPERYRDFTAGLRGVWDVSQADQLEVSYSFDQYDKSKYYRTTSRDVRTYSNVQNSMRMLWTHTVGRGDVLTIGGDYLYDFLLNEKLRDRKRHQSSIDLFAQYDWIINRQWEVVGALRFDHFDDGGDSRLTPKINLRYQPMQQLNLRAGYGMGFRAPTLKEKYYIFNMVNIWDIVGGNLVGEELRPEVSHNFHLSADWTHGPWNLTATAYANVVHDRLTTGSPQPISEFPGDRSLLGTSIWLPYVNLKRYDTRGFDLTAQARWSNGWGAKVSYAYIDEQLARDANGDEVNNQYTPARPHSLTLRADWDHQFSSCYGLSLSLSGRLLSSVDNLEFVDYVTRDEEGKLLRRSIHYGGYSLWKLQAVQRFGEWLRVSATVDNLFDYTPTYHYYNAPFTDGLQLLIGVSIDLH